MIIYLGHRCLYSVRTIYQKETDATKLRKDGRTKAGLCGHTNDQKAEVEGRDFWQIFQEVKEQKRLKLKAHRANNKAKYGVVDPRPTQTPRAILNARTQNFTIICFQIPNF